MTHDPQAAVRAFHEKMGAPVGDKPAMLAPDRTRLRLLLIREELHELEYATGWEFVDEDEWDEVRGEGLAATAKELADLLYVTYGMAVELGIDIAPVFQVVHASNMTKTPGNTREDGKILKGDDYVPPDIASILEKQRKEVDQAYLNTLYERGQLHRVPHFTGAWAMQVETGRTTPISDGWYLIAFYHDTGDKWFHLSSRRLLQLAYVERNPSSNPPTYTALWGHDDPASARIPWKLTEASSVPGYYDVLCTFTCPNCGGLITWGDWECMGVCNKCIDESINET